MNTRLTAAGETFQRFFPVIAITADAVLMGLSADDRGEDIFFQKVCSLPASPYIVAIVPAKKSGFRPEVVEVLALGTPIPDAEMAAAIAASLCWIFYRTGLRDVAILVRNAHFDGFTFQGTSDDGDVVWRSWSGFPHEAVRQ